MRVRAPHDVATGVEAPEPAPGQVVRGAHAALLAEQLLACPSCLRPPGAPLPDACSACGTAFAFSAANVIDFTGGDVQRALALLDDRDALLERELATVRNLDRFAEQDAFSVGLARGLGQDAVVVDVGCGGGGFLRLLGRAGGSPVRVGVDRLGAAIAEASRLGGGDEQLLLVAGRAERLPLRAGICTHLFCLNALTYMPLGRVVAEFARVVRPGGLLVLRTEQLAYDISRLIVARGARGRAMRLRDLAYGVVSAVSPVELPRSKWWGQRAFLGERRLRAVLGRNGFDVIDALPHPDLPAFLGRPTQLTVVARRRDDR